MAVKIILRKDKKSNSNDFPVYLRITENRQSSYIALGFNVAPQYWSEKIQVITDDHPNCKEYNELIYQSMLKIEQIKRDIKAKGGTISCKLIKRLYNSNQSYNFIEFAEKFIANLRDTANYGTFINYRSSVKKFVTFINDNYIDVEDVNVRLLQEYENYLRLELHNSTNTVYNNLKVIRKIIYEAIDIGLIPMSDNPFNKYRLEKTERKKDFLSHEELQAIDSLSFSRSNPLIITKHMFLLSCFTGLKLNVVKSLKWTDIKDGHVKFKHLNEMYNMKLINKAQQVLNNYKSRLTAPIDETETIFPSLSNVYINKNLKKVGLQAGIERNLTFNMARSTFAILAIKKGVRLDVVAKLMGHRNFYSILPYAKSTSRDVDYAYGVLNKEFY